MSRPRVTVTAGLFLAAAVLLPLRSTALEPDRELWQYALSTYGPADGLPSVSVSSLAQTPDGSLWVGTMEGLARFDGFDFEVFHRGNTEAFAQSEIRCLRVDSRGNLWIGTVNGVARWRDGSFSRMGLAGEVVNALTEDAAGQVFAASSLGLSVWEDPTGFRRLLETPPPESHLMALEPDADGGLLLAFFRGQMARRSAAGVVVELGSVPGGRAGTWSSLALLPDGRILGVGGGPLAAWQGGESWAPLAAPRVPLLGPALVWTDRRGEPWVADHGGGAVVRLGTRPSRLDAAGGLLGSQVQAVFEDREGNVWVGTWDGGLTRLADAPFVTYTERDGLPSRRMQVVLATRDGRIWAGTREGLARLDPGEERFVAVSAVDGERIYALEEDHDGSVIAVRRFGLVRIAGASVASLPSPLAAPVDSARTHFVDRQGRHWWTAEDGLVIADGERILETLRWAPTQLPVFAFLEEADGSVLLGLHDGLWLWREGARLEEVPTSLDPAYQVIFALHRDSRGDLWVGALDGGLALRRDGRWIHFGRRDGLPDDNVHALLEDESGNLWGSSSQGIWRLALTQVDAFVAGSDDRLRPLVFGPEDGLLTREGHGGARPVASRDPQGRLWFSTAEGLASIDPARLPPSPSAPSARLLALEVDGETRPPDEPVTLPAGRRRLVLGYGAIHLRAPQRLRFRYRLAGLEEGWIDAGARRRAEYPAVPPGRYRFEVQASLDGESWGEPARLEVAAAAFFWQRPWFFLLVALALVGSGVAAQAVRTRGRLRRELATSRELGELVELGRRVAGLLEPTAVLAHLDEALVARWGEVDRAVAARREGREPVLRWRGQPSGPDCGATLLTALDEVVAGRVPGRFSLVAPLAGGATPFGLIALVLPPQLGPPDPRDRAHLEGIAAQAAVALEGAWQAEEAVRWRQVSEARREWGELDALGRLLFAAAARQGYNAPATREAVLAAAAEALAGGEAGRLESALDRLIATGVLAPLPDRTLRVEREGWLLLPEVREPLAEIARAASEQVGGYRLLDRLGAGGMAEVYHAVSLTDGSPAAVKLLLPHLTRDPEARRRLEREGEIVSGLDHPHLVRLLGRGEHEGRLYLAMELLPGKTLADRLEEGPLSRSDALVVVRGVAAALAALHAAGVVHRDVKSSNVMRRADGTWVLLDLGLARALEGSTLTRSVTVLGTLPYMAPEQLRGDPAGPAADLWSLGVVLHEALTGELPWEGATTVKMALEILRTDERAPRTFTRLADPPLAALLGRLLDPDPGRRLAAAAAVVATIDRL